MKRKARRSSGCGCSDPHRKTGGGNSSGRPIPSIRAELSEGMKLSKCRQCGCMKETLEQLAGVLLALEAEARTPLGAEFEVWRPQMKPLKYSCLGCAHCYPAVAVNMLHKAFHEKEQAASLCCEFEVRPGAWPPVPGDYHALCGGGSCPVAVSTLANAELAAKLARKRVRELCIVGKTETENIGIDKLIKNTITNRAIRYLVVAGRDPRGHQPGKTLVALAANGVDNTLRVIGAPGKRPILRNVTRDEVEAFRRQVEVVDMIDCEDAERIANRVKQLGSSAAVSRGRTKSDHPVKSVRVSSAPNVRARPPSRVELDKAGYFVIIPSTDKGIINVEHYSYDNRLLRAIEGRDACAIYSTIIENGWGTQLSHAAYLGRELTRAEFALRRGHKYVQDGVSVARQEDRP